MYLYAFPQLLWKAASARKKALPYQPISGRLWKSSVMAGMAVDTAHVSILDSSFMVEAFPFLTDGHVQRNKKDAGGQGDDDEK